MDHARTSRAKCVHFCPRTRMVRKLCEAAGGVGVGWGLEMHKTGHAVSIDLRKNEQKAVYILPNMAFRKRSPLTCNKLQQRWDGKDRGVLWVSKPESLEHPILLLNSERKKKPTSPESGWFKSRVKMVSALHWNSTENWVKHMHIWMDTFLFKTYSQIFIQLCGLGQDT